MLYLIPFDAVTIIKGTLDSDGVPFFEGIGSEPLEGFAKWLGGVYDPASRTVVGIPFNSESVLVIDTASDTTAQLAIESGTVNVQWVSLFDSCVHRSMR